MENDRGALVGSGWAVTGALTEAPAIARTGQAGVSGIESQWRFDQAAVGLFANTPEGQAALLRAGQQRITEANEVVAGTASEYGRAAELVRAAARGLPGSPSDGQVPHLPPPPTKPELPQCYIGTKNSPLPSSCSPDTEEVTYVDPTTGCYMWEDLKTGETKVIHEPGNDGGGNACWLPTAGADSSICAPGTNEWVFPQNGNLVTEQLQPDGKITDGGRWRIRQSDENLNSCANGCP